MRTLSSPSGGQTKAPTDLQIQFGYQRMDGFGNSEWPRNGRECVVVRKHAPSGRVHPKKLRSLEHISDRRPCCAQISGESAQGACAIVLAVLVSGAHCFVWSKFVGHSVYTTCLYTSIPVIYVHMAAVICTHVGAI